MNKKFLIILQIPVKHKYTDNFPVKGDVSP